MTTSYMASVSAVHANEPHQQVSGCNHFTHKVDELAITFSHNKIKHCFAEEYEFMSQHFKSCSKLVEEIRVWPPSTDVLVAELTLVCNCLLVEVAQKIHLGSRSAPVCLQLDCLVCHTVIRVLQFASRTPVVPSITQEKDTDIEMAMKKIVTVVKDPVSRFRLLDILGRLVLLTSLCCIYTRLKAGLERTKSLLCVQDQLLKAVGKSVLEETFMYRQGLILCKHDNSNLAEVASICVGDVARLVTLSGELTIEKGSVQHREWHWLDTFLQSKELIKREQYILAMKKLEMELSQPLDPEAKATLLCQFAHCYQKQGCPQLAIQTYKDALCIYKEHHSVLLHLADVYEMVGQQDLKLDILNLLVKVLSAKSARDEKPVFTTDFAAIVISVFQVMPKVTLVSAVHRLAKCCTQLHRYKEAADHYLKLLELLKNVENFTLGSTSYEPLLHTDVKELVVETIETLALAQRNSECLALCDEFYPILSIDGTPPQLSQHMEVATNKEDNAHSQHSFFSLSQHSETAGETMNCSPEHQGSCSPLSPSTRQKDKDSACLTSGILENISSSSRKRNRSSSFDQDVDSQKNIYEDIWWSRSLPVRLLLSKADALVAIQGFTDETAMCLKMAYKLMMTSEASIFVEDKKSFCSTSQPPLKKCKRDNSDSRTSEGSNNAAREKLSEEINISSEFKVSGTWTNFMVKLALRMAKIYLERHQMVSVLNSCHLVLQLEPHNIFAHYLKTVTLQKLNLQKYKASTKWLQERGINLSSAETALLEIVDEKQKEIREKQCEQNAHSNPWWEISELSMVNLDLVSLNCVREQKQSKIETS